MAGVQEGLSRPARGLPGPFEPVETSCKEGQQALYLHHSQPPWFKIMIQQPSVIVSVDGQPFEIFMSFGLLNAITRHVGIPDNVGLITVSADLKELVLMEMLSERSKSGVVTKQRGFADVEISLEDCEALLEFAADQTLDFFLRALEKASARARKAQEAAAALKFSLAGPKA